MWLRMTLVTMAMVIPILAVLAPPAVGLHNKTLPLDDFRTLIFVKYDLNWTTSSKICRKYYTDLVTLYNKTDEEQFLKLLQFLAERAGAFIGLKGPFKWSNGDPVIYMNNTLYGDNMCVAMKADGGWEALQCTQNRTFICYSDVLHRYTLITEKKNWHEAQYYCRENYTDLVSIKDEEQNEAVKTKKKKEHSSWIGLKWDGWEWADGGLSKYNKVQRCKDVNCSDPRKTVVRLSTYEWMPEFVGNSTKLICYKDHIHISNASMTWEESLDYCRGFNGSFCILSHKEQLAATRLMRRLKITEPVWVGLQQSSFLGLWVWTIGESLASNNWKGGQVPQLPLSHHCGALTSEKEDFKWADMNCMTKQRALCYDWVVNEPPLLT